MEKLKNNKEIVDWMNKRILKLQTNYNNIKEFKIQTEQDDINKPDINFSKKLTTGGKLNAYKEIRNYLITHTEL